MENSMSIREWFEDRRKITGLLKNSVERDSKDVNEMERNKNLSIDYVKFNRLWVQCDNCKSLLYIRFLRENKSVCEECGYYLQMNSSDRIEHPIDRNTRHPMDEDMYTLYVLQFHSENDPAHSDLLHSEDESYKDHITFCQIETGLTDAIQTGIGQLNGLPITLGVMDFKFMGGSMGSVVGDKITRLIERTTEESLPVIMVCASGGARMQEGSFSSMQMDKIASALYIHQKDKRLLYVSIQMSWTTGRVTASFVMLGDIIIVEPKSYIAFAGKRVIEQTLGQKVIEDFQVTEHLFVHGLFDLIIPRNLLKGVLSELFQLYSLPRKEKKMNV